MANARSIEVKVGMLILIAVGILTAFVVIMGGLSFQPTYRLNIEFDNPGGVQSGAPVRIAGIAVGKVKEIQFRGASANSTDKHPPLVRLVVAIQKRYQPSIHDNAIFLVTSQGLLGEQYLAIDPGSTDRPVLADGAVVRGLDPPRLDMVLAEGYELLHTAIQATRDNRAEIGDMFEGLKKTLHGTGQFFDTNGTKLDQITSNLQSTTEEANELVHQARTRYVESPQVARILDNLDHTTSSVSRETDPMLHDARELIANANRVSATVGSPEEAARLRQTMHDLAELVGHAKVASADAQAIVSHIKKGNGSVGALVMDEQLYDDVQEMVRDLKHNPWKFFWRQ